MECSKLICIFYSKTIWNHSLDLKKKEKRMYEWMWEYEHGWKLIISLKILITNMNTRWKKRRCEIHSMLSQWESGTRPNARVHRTLKIGYPLSVMKWSSKYFKFLLHETIKARNITTILWKIFVTMHVDQGQSVAQYHINLYHGSGARVINTVVSPHAPEPKRNTLDEDW